MKLFLIPFTVFIMANRAVAASNLAPELSNLNSEEESRDYRPIYQMQDLQVLSVEKNYEEFFKHAYDLRPSARNEEWAKLYTKMALGFLDFLILKKDFSSRPQKIVAHLGEQAMLKKNLAFIHKFEQFYKLSSIDCLSFHPDKEQCLLKIEDFFTRSSRDPDWAFQIMEKIEAVTPLKTPWILYEAMIYDQAQKIYCQKESVFRGIVDRTLTLSFEPTFIEKFSARPFKLLRSIVASDCLQATLKWIKTYLLQGAFEGAKAEFFFKLLEDANLEFPQLIELTKDDRATFYLIYLLKNPPKGETLNYAWKQIELFGENYKLREQTYQRIKSLDFIDREIQRLKKLGPDGPDRDLGLKVHLNKYFPELLKNHLKNQVL